MSDLKQFPPLKPLHPESSLNAAKLSKFDDLSTEVLLASLMPGQDEGCLKTRPDGTILDGHHRICILRRRGVNGDGLQRNIMEKERELLEFAGTSLVERAMARKARLGGASSWRRLARRRDGKLETGRNSGLSLLTPDEERDLDLRGEATEAKKRGLAFYSFPIADRQVPRSEAKLGEMLDQMDDALSAGRNVLVHCRQGVGRSGLVAACLLVKNGMSPGAAVQVVSAARGVTVPETAEQRDWIERYAPAFSK